MSVDGHIKMLAALQTVLSGSCSKTVNMDRLSSPADVEWAYRLAWELRIKCVAVYRDGSKLGQPLSAGGSGAKEAETKADAVKSDVGVDVKPVAGVRRPLPGRRGGYTQKLNIPGHKVYVRTGEYPDGAIGEIFLTTHKSGSLLRSVTDALAVAVSIGLQYGVPLQEFVDAFTFTQFEPNGPVRDHDRLKFCTSILDAVFRNLAVHYLGRDDLAHVPAQTEDGGLSPRGSRVSTVTATATAAGETVGPPEVKYEGTPCRHCGQLRLVRDGTCLVCRQCGTTTGCS